ncbi:type I pantothenate kinase [Weissella ceti]|uniref:Pantothenate kinase n=1 Tax=Weissella ceti TaxID=759620 RepID=A0ABT3E598_9LACO|nr:type I pantothenate kinase [Weissella ceti]MCW0953077.1 type I pantothenate kinase [Weissella ceti]QVK11620.1 type I pantothenate kinase [Weissella ceti]
MNDAKLMNYVSYPKEQWRHIGQETPVQMPSAIDAAFLTRIKAFNDQISLGDVQDVYLPLVRYVRFLYEEFRTHRRNEAMFLHENSNDMPFVIGIAGSVAVGKTTTARLLTYLLQDLFGEQEVALMTTDGFLKTNAQLMAEGMMERKGFPESYDMPKLLAFMDEVKSGTDTLRSPKYSHDISDVMQDEFDEFSKPSILIVEGINTLQSSVGSAVYLSDFFDFSIYIDADTDLIAHWYLDRFEALLDQTEVVNDPENYFFELAQQPRKQALAYAQSVWETVNLPNLTQYILPTRERADLILRKSIGHGIDQIWLRKH